MALTTKTQTDLVDGQVAAMQASSSSLIDFSVGEPLLAICQAIAGVVLWLQALVIQFAALTRLATSFGTDVDSFIADFGMTRLPATPATGQVTFTRFSVGPQVVVQVGALVESADGTQTFAVDADPTNGAYNAGLGGYVLGAGVATVSATVQALTAGSAGNVAAGIISTISDAIPGVDTVSNNSPLSNGIDAESDAAVKARFPLYIGSRSQATPAAVDYAIAAVQQGLDYELVENFAYTGAYQPGYFYVVVDDGSSSPSVPASLITAVQTAISAARPLCAQYGVFSRTLLPITISLTITGGSPAAVQAALAAYVAGAGLGGSVEFSKIAQVAYNADPDVTNVTGELLNGGAADVTATQQQKPSVASITVA